MAETCLGLFFGSYIAPMTVVEHNPEDFKDWNGLHRLLMRGFVAEQGRVDPPPSVTAMTADDLRQKSQIRGYVPYS